jgi:hypothetical protein
MLDVAQGLGAKIISRSGLDRTVKVAFDLSGASPPDNRRDDGDG